MLLEAALPWPPAPWETLPGEQKQQALRGFPLRQRAGRRLDPSSAEPVTRLCTQMTVKHAPPVRAEVPSPLPHTETAR